MLFCSWNRIPVLINLRDCNSLQAIQPLYICNGMTEKQRNPVILKTLDNIPVQTGGEGHNFHTSKNFGTLKGHTSCHNQANIPGTKNDYPFTGHVSFQIYKALCGSGGVYSGTTGPGRTKRSTRPLPAAHSKYHCFCLDALQAVCSRNTGNTTPSGYG